MSATRYDAIVVGAGGTGAATAMLLARSGHRTLVLDASLGLKHSPSIAHLVQPGLVMLRQWGLLDPLLDTGCPVAVRTRITVDGVTFELPIPSVGGIAHTLAPSTRCLALLLTDAARHAGADIRFGHVVQSLLWDGGVVTGVTGTSALGSRFTAKAPIVIGADGARSFVARTVDARLYRRRTALDAVDAALWSDVRDPETAEFAIRPGMTMAILPTHQGAAYVSVACVGSQRPAGVAAQESTYLASLASVPALTRRLRGGSRTSRLLHTGALPRLFRQAYGPGWALVGDAGLVKDPATGRGMSDGLRQASQLAGVLDHGRNRPIQMTTGLAAYEDWRDRTFSRVFDTTADLARPTDSVAELALRLLRNDQAITAEHVHFTGEEGTHEHKASALPARPGSPDRHDRDHRPGAGHRRAGDPCRSRNEGDPGQRARPL